AQKVTPLPFVGYVVGVEIGAPLMLFLHCAGNGDLYTTDGTPGGQVTDYGRGDAAFMAACNAGVDAWFCERDAADFYFYDFAGWGFAAVSVTVPVGRYGQKITFHKPERQLQR
ncbi:MAG: hypothetical protein ACO3FK_12685, partial [Vulcanococcus sp.]|uniref:hypothetical protein n=1 Tax=Vulcanococcus sp. TaxID=2856995 RepID=UPI003C11F92A